MGPYTEDTSKNSSTCADSSTSKTPNKVVSKIDEVRWAFFYYKEAVALETLRNTHTTVHRVKIIGLIFKSSFCKFANQEGRCATKS